EAPPPPAPQAADDFLDAPRAPVNAELRVCSPSGQNVGEIGERGQSPLYSPYIYAGDIVLLRDPTEDVCLSSGFGMRGTADGGGHEHTGIDLPNPNGGFVFAAADGRIAAIGLDGGYGLTLEIDHGEGVHTLYAHLSETDPALAVGDFVPAGRAVARMGRTGNATGVHLHYELSIDGEKVDPL